MNTQIGDPGILQMEQNTETVNNVWNTAFDAGLIAFAVFWVALIVFCMVATIFYLRKYFQKTV